MQNQFDGAIAMRLYFVNIDKLDVDVEAKIEANY